jgi:glycosyltransferase involved in cell wall biosynthesis
MRICFISHSSDIGGAQKVLLETIEILQSKGAECRVVTPGHGELCDALDRLGVPFSNISLPCWMKRGKISAFARVRAFLGILLRVPMVAWQMYRWKCDICFTNTVTVSVGAFAAHLLRRPHLWQLHEFGMEDQGLRFMFGESFSLRLVNKLSMRCVCVSNALAKKYERWIEPSKIIVIYPSMHKVVCEGNQIEGSDFAMPDRNGKFRCVIVGALMEGKGQAESVLAIAELKRRGIVAELMIVGDGIPTYRRHLLELIRSNELEGQVILLGQAKNPFRAMQSSDAVLVCSRSEAFGRVTVEGMLAGKPVVASNTGANLELIQDGVTGLLYKAQDITDLANKIQYLRENPEVAKNIGNDGKSWAEGIFKKERFSNEMIPLLKAVTAPGNSAALDSNERDHELPEETLPGKT